MENQTILHPTNTNPKDKNNHSKDDDHDETNETHNLSMVRSKENHPPRWFPTIRANMIDSLLRTSKRILSQGEEFSISCLHSYRSFLQNNQTILEWIEEILHPLLFLTVPSYSTSSESWNGYKLSLPWTEMLYTLWNTWSFLNHVLLHLPSYLEQESGMTLLLGPTTTRTIPTSDTYQSHAMAKKGILCVRIILSLMECTLPTCYEMKLRVVRDPKQEGEEEDTHSSKKRDTARTKEIRTKTMTDPKFITKVEFIKFCCRLSIIGIHYSQVWDYWKKKKEKHDNQQNHDKGMDEKHAKQNEDERKKESIMTVGILSHGGKLYTTGNQDSCAFRHPMTMEQEEERRKKLFYVGRRTGRRVVIHDTHRSHRRSSGTNTSLFSAWKNRNMKQGNPTNSTHQALRNKIHRIYHLLANTGIHPWISVSSSLSSSLLLSSWKVKWILSALGEFLHIYRPLYWSYRCQENYIMIDPTIQDTHRNQNHVISYIQRYNKWKNLKAWIISLLMDVVSHQLSLLGNSAPQSRLSSNGTNGKAIRKPFSPYAFHRYSLSLSSTLSCWLHSPFSSTLFLDLFHKLFFDPNRNLSSEYDDTISPTTVQELQRRKLRWMLYLLRTPIWDFFTHPIADFVTNGLIRRFLPWMGKPLAQYLMNLLVYRQKWHFLLED